MGFFKFVFAFMILIPVAVLMLFLIDKLISETKSIIKKSAEEEAAKKMRKKAENTYGGRRYAPGYDRPQHMPFSYDNHYEKRTFGSSAAEVKRREQENRALSEKAAEEQISNKSNKRLSKRKRRKERKNRKKDREK